MEVLKRDRNVVQTHEYIFVYRFTFFFFFFFLSSTNYEVDIIFTVIKQ